MYMCVFLGADKMGEKRKKASALSDSVTLETVKVIAESVGVSELSDTALMYIAEEMTFRLRHTVQVCWHLLGYSMALLRISVTLNNASDYRANGLLSNYIGWTNGLKLRVRGPI